MASVSCLETTCEVEDYALEDEKEIGCENLINSKMHDMHDRGENLSSYSEILSAYEEKLEFKDDKDVCIQNISSSGLTKFAPQAGIPTIDKVMELVAWKALGHDIEEDASVPESPVILFKSLRQLLEQETEYLDTCCPLFNKILDGGLRCGTVTEISGESGAGKSQVCLHLASVQAVQGNSVIYLQTEASFPLSRLQQILASRCNDDNLQKTMDSIFIKKIHSYTHMQSVLGKDIPLLIEEKKVKLIIIDSITAVIRGDRDIESVSERTEILQSIGSRIKEVCAKYKIAVVLVNQVSSAIGNPGHTFGRDVIPSLGHLWTNFTNTRLFVTKTDFAVKKEQIDGLQSDSSLRSLEVDFSSFLAENFFNFVVLPSGILGINVTD